MTSGASRSLTGLCLSLLSATAWGQVPESARSAVLIPVKYEVTPNVVYGTANGRELRLDLYRPRDASSPTPVVMFIHGGGWVAGSKEQAVLWLLPYLEMGWAAVNVEYRLAEVSLAPAAVEDCRCALHWVGRNAKKHGFDLAKVVVTGGSAGGHLALTTGMLPASAGFDNPCAAEDDPTWSGVWPDQAPKVAAVVNWYGITDVAAMLHGRETRSYAVSWLGSLPNREQLAKQLSPVTYVRGDLPPILTIHGDADPIVPYAQAVRLHEALTKAGVRNQLLTIPGGKHGRFTPEQTLRAHEVIREFLARLNLGPVQ